ncbi:galactokinase [Maribacter halichondriae]|uniref:galactokinase n=1 Tax=Maribacter halichondriae TaxID=2980554 RepID=UPI0023594E7D|nr:galactokinase [Maribacter sp. Hal144]
MEFLKRFKPDLTISSPGRINLIGEHTDYNLGYVLPTAIEKIIELKFQKNSTSSACRVYSKDFDKGFEFDLKRISVSTEAWENYVLGVLNEILKRTDKVRGFDCVLESNLPLGSGLSSSAALECGIAFGLNELFDLKLSKMEMVSLSQIAEHTYVGTQCGIMDQFASVMSEAGHVILLDCRSLEHQLIPMKLHPYKIIMLNTGVSHNLATSEYNVRKKECEEGVAIIKEKYPTVESLRDVSEKMLESCKLKMTDIVYRRCHFIINENARVLQAAKALQEGNLEVVGQLLYEAHEGISTWYEVSCAESDFLVEFSKKYIEVLGARQTGGGFGGCTMNIVHEDAVERFVQEISDAYKKRFGIELSPFEVRPSNGTQVI